MVSDRWRVVNAAAFPPVRRGLTILGSLGLVAGLLVSVPAPAASAAEEAPTVLSVPESCVPSGAMAPANFVSFKRYAVRQTRAER